MNNIARKIVGIVGSSVGDVICGEVSMEEFCQILSEAEERSVITLDLGSAIIHRIAHPTLGEIGLVNTMCGRSAIMR